MALVLAAALLSHSARGEGGIILERGVAAGSAGCRQGAVEWLGGGSRRCGAPIARLEDAARTDRISRVSVEAARSSSAPASAANKGAEEARRQILLQELTQERTRLAALQVAGADPAAIQAQQRTRQDVLALERELARLSP